MGPKISCGLYVPNADFGWKYSSLGATGLPDGWTASAGATTDLVTPARIHWVPILIGGGASLGRANVDGSGRALRIIAPAALGNSASRYLLSPRGASAQLPGSEPFSAAYMAAESATWWARIRVRFLGQTPAPANDWSLNLRQLNATESSDVSCGSLTIAAASWTGDWVDLVSSPIAIDLTSSALDHVRVRLIVASGPSSGSSVGIFDSFTIETLGPIDFAEQTTGLGLTAAGADHETFYEFNRSPRHEGSIVGNLSTLAKGTTLPSGARFSFDPSGGAVKRTFEYGYRLLKNPDAEKVKRLWASNKGRGGSGGGISYGIARPLVVIPSSPYYTRPAYVDFDGEAFPLEIDGAFEESNPATALWRGQLRFVEV